MKPRRGGLRGKDSSGGWTAATCMSIKQDDCGSPLPPPSCSSASSSARPPQLRSRPIVLGGGEGEE